MSVPTPSELLQTVPSADGSVCGRFKDLFKFPSLFADIYKHERNEQGDITPEFCAEIQACAGLATGGGTTGGGSGSGSLAAPVISASDGDFPDKVRITWAAIAGATQYLVYRAGSDNAAQAVLLATALTTTYDDTTAVVDTTYYYWVKASDGTNVSPLSASDAGYFSTPLPSVSDLDATKGNTSDLNPSPAIWLQWTPVVGATRWDIYRSATNDFATATKVDSDRVPFDNALSLSLGPAPNFVDNGTDLIYIHHPVAADRYKTFYFWVVAKKSSPNAVSAQSNTCSGWCIGTGVDSTPDGSDHITTTAEHTVIGSPLRAWIYMYGGAGSGAGGGLTFGGGGGGAGAALWGQVTVAAGGKFQLVRTGTSGTNAPHETNGVDGAKWELQYKAPAGSYVTILTSDVAGGGKYSSTGGGAGGAGGVATVGGGVSSGGSKDGVAGMPGMGQKGGRSGHVFAAYRVPPAHFDGVPGSNGDSSEGGGGSMAVNPQVNSAIGGKGLDAVVSIVYYNA